LALWRGRGIEGKARESRGEVRFSFGSFCRALGNADQCVYETEGGRGWERWQVWSVAERRQTGDERKRVDAINMFVLEEEGEGGRGR
jgi:hypothetical protein